MFQAIAQERVGKHTIPHNIRMGGFKHRDAAVSAAKRDSIKHDRPCIVSEYGRGIVGMAQSGVFTSL